jgi:hypothetical protein
MLALSDRIIVMHRGSVQAEFSRENATPEKVLAAAMGSGLQPAREVRGAGERLEVAGNQ